MFTARYIFVREVLIPNPRRKKELTVFAIEAVIFDLDGTLAHFNLDYKALRSEVRTYLMSIHVPVSVLDANESIFEMLKKQRFSSKIAPNPLKLLRKFASTLFQSLKDMRWKRQQPLAC